MSTSEEMPYQDQPSSSARPIHISSDRFDHGGRVHSVSRKIRRVMRKSPPEEFQRWRDCLFHLANANLWPANGWHYHPRFLGKAPYVFAQGIDALPHNYCTKTSKSLGVLGASGEGAVRLRPSPIPVRGHRTKPRPVSRSVSEARQGAYHPGVLTGRCVRWLFLALFDNGGKPHHCQSGAPPKARAPIERCLGGIACRLPL